jgi:hypothetical protein
MKVLIVGCERSGTTVIAKLLSESTNTSLLNDPSDSWYIYPLINIIGIKGFTFNLILRLWRYDIVKIPGFATILNHVRRVHLKKYKVIYVVRDPRDTVAAIKERLNEDYNGLYLNIHYLGKKGGGTIDNILNRWIIYLNRAKNYKKKYPKDIMFVKYEDFLKDKEITIKTIADFCKLNCDLGKIDKLKDRQINKSWSNVIKGSNRYKTDLNSDEINFINENAKELLLEFNYK